MRFVDAKRGVDVAHDVVKLVPFGSGAVVVDWASAEDTDIEPADLETAPAGPATFGALPTAAAKASSYAAWMKDFARTLQQEQVLTLFFDAATALSSAPDETEAAFRARVTLKDRETRDAEKERLRQKYAKQIGTLTERIRRAEQQVQAQAQQASDAKLQTGISVLGTIAGALFGRKTISAGTLGKATTAARGMGRTMRESADVSRAAGDGGHLQGAAARRSRPTSRPSSPAWRPAPRRRLARSRRWRSGRRRPTSPPSASSSSGAA